MMLVDTYQVIWSRKQEMQALYLPRLAHGQLNRCVDEETSVPACLTHFPCLLAVCLPGLHVT